MKCANCARDNDADALHCAYCGTRIVEDKTAAVKGSARKEASEKPEKAAGRVFETVIPAPIEEEPEELRKLRRALEKDYDILGAIGSGGMGKVYHAREKSISGREVALKVLTGEKANDESFTRRFHGEISLLSGLTHENIVTLYGAGIAEGVPFYAMRYVRGVPLSGLIKSVGRIAPLRAVEIAMEICRGLSYAHRRHIIHRDIKPSNIFLGENGETVIGDFGISKALGGERHTKTGAAIGSPEYMSPEQCAGNELDYRSDLYSLGVVLYEMLTGKVPFEGDTLSVMYCHIHQAPPDMEKNARNLPPRLVRMVKRLMSKEPKGRPATAEEAYGELKAISGQIKPEGAGSLLGGLSEKLKSLIMSGMTLRRAALAAAAIAVIASVPYVFTNVKERYYDPAHGTVKTVGGIEFVYIKGGEFWMGSRRSPEELARMYAKHGAETSWFKNEQPLHRVTLNGFWMGKYEVTQGQYKAVMGSNPSYYKGDSRRPVEQVSWHDVKSFCEKFGAKHGVIARLPTEAEWEYAARAGTSTEHYWGDDPLHACSYANVADRAQKKENPDWNLIGCNDGYAGTAPAGMFRPNAWGLFDMTGNVWEWCEDWYDANYYSRSPTKNPKGPESSPVGGRVLRGGSWGFIGSGMRSAVRDGVHPAIMTGAYGFRVVVVTSR